MAILATLALSATSALAGPPPSVVRRAEPGSVNLYRDRHGMAHLYAEREEDAYFGLGYAEAEDRLGGLLLSYLWVSGRLAEHFGRGALGLRHGIAGIGPTEIPDMVESDREARRARFLLDARKNLKSLDPQVRRNMQAFVDGVARYMRDFPEKVPAWAPALEPALPVAFEAFMMGGVSGQPRACDALPAESSPTNGSNITAIAGRRTIDGASIFTSDSHGGFAYFGTFLYPARIVGGSLDAFLVDPTGAPMGLKGHGTHFAWGWAEGPRRPADCLVVETSAAGSLRYRFDGRLISMEQVPYRIAVRGEAPVLGHFRYTRHNGVRSPVVRTEGRQAFVVSSAYSGRAGRAIEQFTAMLKARNWRQMDAALDRREIYPANIAIAGPGGSILYMRPGRIPHRPAGVDVEKPVDGSTSKTAWLGIRATKELIQLRDPPQGYVTNENASPDMMFAKLVIDPANYPADFAIQPGRTRPRQQRAIQLLEGDRKLSFDDALAIVGDATIPGYEAWNAALVGARKTRLALPVDAPFLDSVQRFDGAFTPASLPALQHALWRIMLRKRAEVAPALEIAIAQGRPLSNAQEDLLFSSAIEAQQWLTTHHPQARGFGDVFRIGRGASDAPARGITLLPIDPDDVTDFGSLWAPVFEERASDRRFVTQSGTRLPFIVQFTAPIKSYSLALPGISDQPGSRHYSDNAVKFGDARLNSNFLTAVELTANLESVRTLRTSPIVRRR